MGRQGVESLRGGGGGGGGEGVCSPLNPPLVNINLSCQPPQIPPLPVSSDSLNRGVCLSWTLCSSKVDFWLFSREHRAHIQACRRKRLSSTLASRRNNSALDFGEATGPKSDFYSDEAKIPRQSEIRTGDLKAEKEDNAQECLQHQAVVRFRLDEEKNAEPGGPVSSQRFEVNVFEISFELHMEL